MQRPIIFIATADPNFESLATDAILGTHHGMRRARKIDDACRLLGEGTQDIALAIVDLDFHERGFDLLKILGSCEPDFPILVVTDTLDHLLADESVSGIAIDYLIKPVSANELQQMIKDLCRESETLHEGHVFQTFRQILSAPANLRHLNVL